ncbi:uncharacterized protein NPIL_585521 [Nephila pilipes]|uniref:Uncharacterized protein n=1 Tax=Nephila pilipes TaxID=299642 RepID=A0A8X6IIF1_NEPPI|nr:uncharacterized protein NPIL_585521 [Nephila pilipes]
MNLLQAFVFPLVAVSSVIAIKGYPNDFIFPIVKANACVSRNGSQEMCDQYVQCGNDHFKNRLKDAFEKCRDKVYPNGFGKCNGDETLYISPEDQEKFETCFTKEVPERNDLTDEEAQGFRDYKDCVYKYGGTCSKILEDTSSL